MKLRVIIWIVVGIIVVAGVIFLVITGKSPRAKKISLDDLKRQAERSTNSINKLTARLMEAKATPLPPEKSQLVAEVEKNLNEARSLLDAVKNSSDLKQAEKDLRSAHRLIRQSRRLLQQLTKVPRTVSLSFCPRRLTLHICDKALPFFSRRPFPCEII